MEPPFRSILKLLSFDHCTLVFALAPAVTTEGRSTERVIGPHEAKRRPSIRATVSLKHLTQPLEPMPRP